MMIQDYPRTLFANVLLIDGKIINWKIGKTDWSGNAYLSNRQPINLLMKANERGQSIAVAQEVYHNIKNHDEWEEAMLKAKDFCRLFELHEEFSLIPPYKRHEDHTPNFMKEIGLTLDEWEELHIPVTKVAIRKMCSMVKWAIDNKHVSTDKEKIKQFIKKDALAHLCEASCDYI